MDHRQQTSFQRLELEHAQRDAGALEDIENSNALTTDQSEFSRGYVLRMLAAIASIGMGTNAAYWGFSPPAAILTYINEDIGPSDNASLFPIIWTLACGISIIFFGRFSDKFGRR
ncbi:uncharacterized protein PV07_12086 [Cladophialophora immunda]|uniref:Major facilitator superfamily (MFS) profile domain-containing protein n=1 Tax=Cladophialophora immunda TaxID=569365 RepID=A0A0D2C060_9EURO|nr:uncharacterized protein PV07_12086 [Cladophialophora immunda]KIW23925.1 hypothetical protein PV07_12086 [Cladophialophora immunda]